MLYNILYPIARYGGNAVLCRVNKSIKNQSIMNKQTFPIPEGCKAITMEIIDNTIVTTFEPQFKRGGM